MILEFDEDMEKAAECYKLSGKISGPGWLGLGF
jgi:hypothetical protein